ncbi:MAG: carbohydrate binding domain-containing protein [Prevotellaceae bacterium]|nr:carbohydrate binding domain-containing protein [Prevotellaceae bacterium]
MKRTLISLLAFMNVVLLSAQAHRLEVNTSKRGAAIPSTMYGIFFEDINFAADGGLYAELVKNRSFEFPDHLMGWKPFGSYELRDDGPFSNNPHYLRLLFSGRNDKYTGVENEGFFGMGYQKGGEYKFSVWARNPNDDGEVSLIVQLCNPATMGERQQIAEANIIISDKEWRKYEVELLSPATVAKGSLRIVLAPDSKAIDIEHVSLFPKEVYRNDENGLRKDLAEALEQLRPGIFRFPGGCVVEGNTLETRYQWKNSVGPVENRPLNENRWNYTFDHRMFPDYFQSYGLGFFEYFRLAEQIGAEPLPIISVGLSCEFANGAQRCDKHVEVEHLQPYIDDVLDLIEFANGDPSTNRWAKIRAEMGHPAPFNLKYIGIGNEQWGDIYPENLKPFVEQVRKRYPSIRLVGSSGPYPDGKDFDHLWPSMRKIGVDLVDEHFYRNEDWFLKSGNRYDNYSRKGTKVFAGEYACHGTGKKWNHFNAALMEAAFMTGLERNSDVVLMSTYAPLFAHVEGWQWRPDAIWFDNLTSFKTCSYYVQQLYSLNKGSYQLPLTMEGKPVAGNVGQDGLFASAVFDKESNSVIIKVVNTGKEAQRLMLNLKGMKGTHSAELITFHADAPDGENTIEQPLKYAPKSEKMEVSAPEQECIIPANTFQIYKIRE